MDVIFRYVCVAVFTVVGLNNVLAQEVVYAELGGKLELRAETVSKPITGILWKIGNDFVAELLEGSEPDYYRSFKGRTTLTKEKATLVVSSLTENDAGVYSVEINSQVQSKTYMVKVIKAVPKPKVEAKPLVCSKKESCDLVCEGDTTGTKPVTYSWKTDDGAWKESGKTWTITRTNDSTAEHFSCKLENPVGFKESERFANPFWSPPNTVGAIIGAVVGLLVLVLVGVVVVWKRKEICGLFGRNDAEGNPGNGQVAGQPASVPPVDGEKSENLPLREDKSANNEHDH
ncbi:T-lymphocyte surface antigen Ly-9-like [Polymixia lowei]